MNGSLLKWKVGGKIRVAKLEGTGKNWKESRFQSRVEERRNRRVEGLSGWEEERGDEVGEWGEYENGREKRGE